MLLNLLAWMLQHRDPRILVDSLVFSERCDLLTPQQIPFVLFVFFSIETVCYFLWGKKDSSYELDPGTDYAWISRFHCNLMTLYFLFLLWKDTLS